MICNTSTELDELIFKGRNYFLPAISVDKQRPPDVWVMVLPLGQHALVDDYMSISLEAGKLWACNQMMTFRQQMANTNMS